MAGQTEKIAGKYQSLAVICNPVFNLQCFNSYGFLPSPHFNWKFARMGEFLVTCVQAWELLLLLLDAIISMKICPNETACNENLKDVFFFNILMILVEHRNYLQKVDSDKTLSNFEKTCVWPWKCTNSKCFNWNGGGVWKHKFYGFYQFGKQCLSNTFKQINKAKWTIEIVKEELMEIEKEIIGYIINNFKDQIHDESPCIDE